MRTNIRKAIIALALILAPFAHAQVTDEKLEFEYDRRIAATSKSYRPNSGYAPDSATAIAIARAVLISVYGKKTIEDEEPLRAELKGNVWTVIGTLKGNYVGGTAVLQLRKDTAAILFVIHTQ
jgi:NTF2 fold immunity protein